MKAYLIHVSSSTITIVLFFLFVACNSNSKAKSSKETAQDSIVYFPINNYIRQQIKDVDTTPYYLYRVLIINGKKDSSTINKSIFDSTIKQFILPDIDEKPFKENFTESVYEDASTNSITLSYSPKTNNTIVQNATVLLDTASQNVRWIFINTLQNAGDSSVIQKIGWKSGKSCYLNRAVNYANGNINQQQLTIVWNDK